MSRMNRFDRQPMAFSCIGCSTESDTPRDCWEPLCLKPMTPTPRRPVHHHDREEDAA